jgi:hypothetical protein
VRGRPGEAWRGTRQWVGLYWMIPAVVAGLVGGVINAWLVLVNVS